MKAAFFNCFIHFTFANHVVEIFREQCKRACCQCFEKDLNNLDCHERITEACKNNYPSKIVCESEFSEERKNYEDEECPQCAHCKYCDIHNQEPNFYDYENPGDDYYYYYHGKQSVASFQFKGEFMKICEDWNEPPMSSMTSIDSNEKTTGLKTTTISTTTPNESSFPIAPTKSDYITTRTLQTTTTATITTTTTTRKTTKKATITTSKTGETTEPFVFLEAFDLSKSFNISKAREENCSKFCNQRFLQNKFHEIALIWADFAVQEKAIRKGKAKRKSTFLRKVIDHRERNFKCRKGEPIPAKIFNVKCCENIANKAADEEETIDLLCDSIVKFYEFTDEKCTNKTWIFRVKRFCEKITE